MKMETIKHPTHTVSCISESMAENFKDKITKEQLEVLKHNVYSLKKEDAIYDKYKGCGSGWIEIDKNGDPIELKYLDDAVVDIRSNGYEEWEDEYAELVVVASQECQALYLNTGDTSQNINSLEFHIDQLMPLILPNGNMRLLVNFSCYQLVRF